MIKDTSAPAAQGKAAAKSGEKKGHSLQFRARPALRSKLDEAAAEAGRSLSEEIEYRLTKSFEGGADRAAELLFGSRMNVHHLTMYAAVLDSISDLARKVSDDPEDEWWESTLGRAGAAAAFDELTAILIGPRDVVLTDDEVDTVHEIKVMALTKALRLARDADRRESAQRRQEGRVDYAAALGLMAEGKGTEKTGDE